jgi:molybdate transport system ATP-binding protein
MLYVSHSLDELQQICNKLLVLSQGKVIGYDAIHSMIHQLNYSNIDANSEELIHRQTSLSLPIKTPNNGQGLAILTLNNNDDIFLPALDENECFIKEDLRCFILANDISISLAEPINSSIVNHLFVTISAINIMENQTMITARTLKCTAKQEFFINISTFSQQKLSLKINQQIYLQFKASAVRTYQY